jgi:hypothetical protein
MIYEEFAPGIGNHETLNPALWNEDETLRPEVKQALLRIAEKFYQFLDIPVHIIDTIVTGSQANFHYTPHSDLDLHIIVPYDDIQCDQPIEELFDAKRKLWKLEHTIAIHGVPVECYAENNKNPVKGSSYSIKKDHWIHRPEDDSVRDIPYQDLHDVCSAWTRVITAAIKSKDIDQLKKIKEMLGTYRKVGLAKQGEFGRANIVFKTLRNSGVISGLHQAYNLMQDRDLSVAQD